ncbi:MAG TPA: hypothetical protein VF905_04180 [Nitrospirota bacterium]
MTEKTVQLLDISPHQRNLTCLPFGIYDWSHQLLQALHNEVARRHGDDATRIMMANALVGRYQIVTQNRFGLANIHHKAPEQIQVYHLLSRVMEVEGQHVQYLYSDIIVPLHDAKLRLAQPPLCIILNEDLKTWKEIALLVGQLCEDSAAVSAEKQPQGNNNVPQVLPSPKRSKRALN